MIPRSYDTSETIEQEMQLLADLVAELAQPDYMQEPPKEQQLELQLRN